jgi:hypothetical protein
MHFEPQIRKQSKQTFEPMTQCLGACAPPPKAMLASKMVLECCSDIRKSVFVVAVSRSKTEVIFFLTIILYLDTSQSERSDLSRSSKASPFRPNCPSHGTAKAPSARRGYHSRRRQVLLEMEEGMIIALYIAAAVIMAVGSLYFAWRNRDFRKFLSLLGEGYAGLARRRAVRAHSLPPSSRRATPPIYPDLIYDRHNLGKARFRPHRLQKYLPLVCFAEPPTTTLARGWDDGARPRQVMTKPHDLEP